jgi:hypothetical protein
VNTITITDPELLAQLAAAPGFVEFRDSAGRVLGTFFLDGYGVPPPGVTSPFTEEELAEARKQTGGKSLSEILKRLQAGDGK